jgi:hypothetical protein
MENAQWFSERETILLYTMRRMIPKYREEYGNRLSSRTIGNVMLYAVHVLTNINSLLVKRTQRWSSSI